MRRCLLCGREFSGAALYDALYSDDPLCLSCRRKWIRKTMKMTFRSISLEASYIYNDAYSAALIQYKECGDEALADIFLYPVRNHIRLKYREYTLVPMPSTEQKRAERGFDHVSAMFACTGLPVMELFVKQGNSDQKRRSRNERILIRDEICLKQGVKLPEKILLIDDTITTGATLQAALSLLEGSGKNIRIYTVSANRRWYKLPFGDRNDIME